MLSVQWLFHLPSGAASPACASPSPQPPLPPPPPLSSLLSLLPTAESSACTRFHYEVDRMRAAVSRCAVRSFLSLATGQPSAHTHTAISTHPLCPEVNSRTVCLPVRPLAPALIEPLTG